MDHAQEQRLRDAAAWAVARGSLLFHLDLAGALARDFVAEHLPELEFDSWAVDIGPYGYEVVFLADGTDREFLGVTFSADGSPIAETRRGAPSPRLRALAESARTLSALPLPEWRAIVVAPPSNASEPDTPIDGYVLRLADLPGDIAFGTHEVCRLSADGRYVLSREALSRSTLVVPGETRDLAVTHLLGDAPSEVHVWLSLKHGMPISVLTTSNQEHWVVDGESISLV